MKVAIPSDNQETISKRTGQSKGFMVYEKRCRKQPHEIPNGSGRKINSNH
jgi:predicted Fe-Mo cluster-binding NifX family protein